ncbi:MAG TPA: hypothetical protein VEX39_01400 [Thermoleophilaceae bacterium]|nr:hypothetical protein [Thermoleophilaceae bacterium]
MLALLVCENRACRAAFEAEGAADAIGELLCQDCGGPLRAVGYADAEPDKGNGSSPEVRRAA